MKLRTFIFGYVLILAIFLFAKRHEAPQSSSSFSRVVDLTKSANGSIVPGTTLEAPAQYSPSLWTVDQIPAERLIAPLVVLDVRAKQKTDSEVSVDDIADWERTHGEIPTGAVVVAEISSNSKHDYSMDAAQFLIEGRNILGLGVDGAGFSAPKTDKYVLSHSVYRLENVGNLDVVPPIGSVVVIAPSKLQGAKVAPARMLAMVR